MVLCHCLFMCVIVVVASVVHHVLLKGQRCVCDMRTLSHLKRELRCLVKYVAAEDRHVLSRDEVERLLLKFDPQNLRLSSSGTSIVVNKEDLRVCVREPSGATKPHSQNIHEAIHLLAHVVDRDIGHHRTFWDIKERLMKAYDVAVACVDAGTARRIVAARRIQCAWRRCISCPTFLVCRKRLDQEWHDSCLAHNSCPSGTHFFYNAP